MLAVTLSIAIAPEFITAKARAGVCLLLGGEDCGGDVPPSLTDEDFKPVQCKLREDSEKAGSEVKIAWFKIGQEFGFIRQEFSDGSVRLTLVDGASIGAVGGSKDKLFDIGKLGDSGKGAASVEVAAGLKFAYGSTWQFKDADESEKFRGEIEKYAMQQQQLRHSGGGGVGIAIYNSLTDNWADPPDPAITFGSIGFEASLKGALGLKIPTGPAGTGGKVPTADPNVGAALTIKGDYQVLTERNARTGTTSWVYQLSGEGTLSGNAVVAGGELGGRTTGAVRVTRNEKGELVSLGFISTREGSATTTVGGKSPVDVKGVKGNGKDSDKNSRATVTVTTLPLDSAADRAIAQRWLSGADEQFGSPLRMAAQTLVPDRPAEPGDEFGRLLHERATVARTTYDNVTDLQEFGAELNLGWKFGFKVSMQDTESVAAESTYLGAPGSGGIRPMLPFEECQ